MDMDLDIDENVNELNELDVKGCDDGFLFDALKRTEVEESFWQKLRAKESLLKQKSRQKWVREGDANTKFFHAGLQIRRRKNQIIALKKDDTWIEGVQPIKQEVKRYFESFFAEDGIHRPRLDGISFSELSVFDADLLTAPFEEQEVKEAIWSCDGDRSPGPDGFTFNFVKDCWKIIKEDIMGFLGEFHRNGVLPKAVTASFLTLTPKGDHPQSLTDYRPICLIGCMYKIIAHDEHFISKKLVD
jgi:hypothetical protein